jgi:CheY-like chemotaxis protein
MAELALRETLPEDASEMVSNIKQAGNSLLSIINDILDFSKIESGKMEIVEAEYQFSSLIHDVVSLISTKLADTPIDFLVEIDNELPSVMIGDDVRIKQVLINLLSNSSKFTKKGFIKLKVEKSIDYPDPTGEVTLVFSVIDSGIGIKPEDMDKLFGHFAQFDKVANRSIEGTGLCLAISRNLTNLMGGDLTCQSVYGDGSTFIARVKQRYPECPPLAKLNNPKISKILVIEPKDLMAESIKWTLDKLEVNLTTVVKTLEEAKPYIVSDKYKYLFAEDSIADKVMKLVKTLKRDIKLVFISPFGSSTRLTFEESTLSSPIYCLPVANLLNDSHSTEHRRKRIGKVSFTAPEAKVLIVDDLEINLKVAKGLMMPFKLNVDLCTSGQGAIEMIKARQYDLVFMDHMMPGMDGLEATEEIRKLPGGESVPIVALTANAVSGVKEMFLSRGMSDFLSKPIEVAKLESLLTKWIPKEKRLDA